MVITTAHAHKSGAIFHFFQELSNKKKIKALRPKMTKIASEGGGPALRFSIWLFCCVRLTTSTHDIDFKFSGVKECNKTRFKT